MSKEKSMPATGIPLSTSNLPSHCTKPLEQLRPVSLAMRAKMFKTEFIALVLARGYSLNRWEAAILRDSCLNSTIPSISKKFGVEVSREMEKVPTFAGKSTEAMRYWLGPIEQALVVNRLGTILHRRGLFDSVSQACQFVSGVV